MGYVCSKLDKHSRSVSILRPRRGGTTQLEKCRKAQQQFHLEMSTLDTSVGNVDDCGEIYTVVVRQVTAAQH